ncbi:MAG: uracil-DNA glycosylase family protein [Sphingobium sp.]
MLSAPVTTDFERFAAAYSDWWALAGVDAAVREEPRGWLAHKVAAPVQRAAAPEARTASPPKPVVDEPVVIAPPPPAPMPDSLDAFMAWLEAGRDQPETDWATHRLLPRLIADAQLMIVTDMPGDSEMDAGMLLSGDEGALIRAMLRALRIEEAEVSVASLFLSRPMGGQIDAHHMEAATMRIHHMADLTRPRRLLLIGDRTSRALSPADDGNRAEYLPFVNLKDRTVPTMHIPAPLMLFRHPARKAAAWAQLREVAVRR